MTQAECTVALVGAEEAPTQHLKSALEQSGAQVVFESSNIEDELEQLKQSGAKHWVLSLDPDGDVMDAIFDAVDELDDVEIILDDPAVSSHLEGWDLARWARHLAAKVLKSESLLPPIPEHAAKLDLPMDRDLAHLEALNSNIHTGIVNEDAERDESSVDVDESNIPIGDVSDIPDFSLSLDEDWDNNTSSTDQQDDAAASFELVDDKAEAMLSDDTQASGDESLQAFDEAFANFTDGLDVEAPKAAEESNNEWEMPDLSAFADQAEEITGAPKLTENDVSEPSAADVKKKDDVSDLLSDEFSDSGLSELLDFTEDDAVDANNDGLVDFDEAFANLSQTEDSNLALNEPLATEPNATGAAAEDADDGFGLDFDAEFERLAAEIDGEGSDVSDSGSEGVLDVAPWELPTEKEQPSVAEPKTIETSPPAATDASNKKDDALSFDFSNLSLMDMEEEKDNDLSSDPLMSQQVTPSSVSSQASNKKEETLAELEQSGAFDGLSLEDVVEAEELPAENPEAVAAESVVLKTPDKLERVIAIGSSIGGPDALRSLLTELPKGIQAAIVIAQHLDGAVFERLAKQLDKACEVTVLLANDLLPLRYGSVMVVPEKSHLIVNPDGQVKVMAMEEETAYSPDISKTFSNLAEMFGDKLTAIVLSGMAGDAVDGAAKVVEKGGQVWVQSPESCVVGTMVEGVMNLGIHRHTGTPRELGRLCIEQFGVHQPSESE